MVNADTGYGKFSENMAVVATIGIKSISIIIDHE
jgi:hypothetical protein